jgi:uncharacterized FAD-dependent dehydrogenase
MIRITELKLPLDHAPGALAAAVARRLGVASSDIVDIIVFRRGYDARQRRAIELVYTLDVTLTEKARKTAARVFATDTHISPTPDTVYRLTHRAPNGLPHRPLVVGTGPCGVFAALLLAQMGFRPLILERGKAVRERTKDTWAFWRRSDLQPESNVQFGEGGAGTFSDGKLYSGVSEPERYRRKVLTEFIKAGAPEEIRFISKPHVGTFRLVSMVEAMRAEIEALGGEYRFGTRVVDLEVETRPDGSRHVRGVHLADGGHIRSDHVVLAIGHSARDTFEMLETRGVFLEAKPFSIGVRIEHPQSQIDRVRFGDAAGHPLLGAADYKLVHHGARGRSVYSFCMCPGGRVVAAASEPGRLVTNGMSQYSRAEFNANAGLVVGVTPAEDFPGGPLAGVALQREIEQRAFIAGGSDYRAPVQTVGDLLAQRASTSLGDVTPSYKPGVTPADLRACLPAFVIDAIREALPHMDRKLPGFARAEATLTGVETRTSSPLRIRRDATGQSINTSGLFPAGEGAGYAGGILSAGIDGIKTAEWVAAALTGRPR